MFVSPTVRHGRSVDWVFNKGFNNWIGLVLIGLVVWTGLNSVSVELDSRPMFGWVVRLSS